MSERVPIEVTRQDRIYCLKASSDYHSELCEECRFYPNCDHTTQDDLTELTIKDLEVLEQEPTTKNDLAVEKTNMIDKSNFSQEQYKTDLQSAYDSGYEQAKNDLEVDWESYKDVDGNSLDDLILEVLQNNFDCGNTYGYKVADEIIGLLPSVTPQEPQTFKWCTNCKEYDQEKHCCHRWSNVIRDTVEEMKQGYIEREVLDKIRAEIEAESAKSFRYPNWERAKALEWALSIIDKYKTESEG